jgi:hypothetical protein
MSTEIILIASNSLSQGLGIRMIKHIHLSIRSRISMETKIVLNTKSLILYLEDSLPIAPKML